MPTQTFSSILCAPHTMRLTRQLKVEDAHDDAVWCCAWVPGDGPHGGDLITGSVDEAVKVWRPPPAGESGGAGAADAIPLEPLHTYVGHTLGAVSVAADATGTYGASASLDSFVRVWSLADAR
jgi:WD repeat-containing protein 61